MPDELFLRDIIRFGGQCWEIGYLRHQNPYLKSDVILRAAWDRGWLGLECSVASTAVMDAVASGWQPEANRGRTEA